MPLHPTLTCSECMETFPAHEARMCLDAIEFASYDIENDIWIVDNITPLDNTEYTCPSCGQVLSSEQEQVIESHTTGIVKSPELSSPTI